MLSAEKRKREKKKMCCHECGEAVLTREDHVTIEVYDSPFDERSRTIHLHTDNEICADYGISCAEALYDEQWADFRYFDCLMCGRTIIRQCPSNGWHSYVQEYEGEDICLRCYETITLKEGIARESFEEGKIHGMFFSRQELRDAGYQEVEGMEDAYIRTQSDVERYCHGAIRIMDQGYSVVTDYERMAIGGLEGYVTLWARPMNGNNKRSVSPQTDYRIHEKGGT